MIDLQYLIFFLLCILQPICLPVPEATTILSGTLTIGANPAFVIGLIGILLGILTMYKITSYLSKKFLRNFKKNQHYKTYQKMMQSNPFLTTGILFAIPILPDEIICIGSALGNVPLKILFPIAIVAKVVSVGMITYSSEIAELFSLNQWEVIALEIILMLVASTIYSKYKKSQNKKLTSRN